MPTRGRIADGQPFCRTPSTRNSFGRHREVRGSMDGFMEHLSVVHMEEDGWPMVDMPARIKCIVGHRAEQDEEWDRPVAAECSSSTSVGSADQNTQYPPFTTYACI